MEREEGLKSINVGLLGLGLRGWKAAKRQIRLHSDRKNLKHFVAVELMRYLASFFIGIAFKIESWYSVFQ